MRSAGKRLFTASLAVAGAIGLAASADAAPTLDGNISASDGWNPVFTDNGVEVFIQSDSTNLYFAGDTPDDDDGSSSPGGFDDAFNINFGLDGNPAAWRYRLLSQNGSFTDNGGSSTTFDGVWEGFLQGGDDSVVANTSFGVPGSLTNLDGTQVGYAVSATNGTRQHEIAIPWALLIDGQNGWDAGSSLNLRIGGYYGEDWQSGGEQFGIGIQTGGGIDYGDQSTYALTTTSAPVAQVPLPATLLMLLAGIGALGMARHCARG
jgi:hypothetical protein